MGTSHCRMWPASRYTEMGENDHFSKIIKTLQVLWFLWIGNSWFSREIWRFYASPPRKIPLCRKCQKLKNHREFKAFLTLGKNGFLQSRNFSGGAGMNLRFSRRKRTFFFLFCLKICGFMQSKNWIFRCQKFNILREICIFHFFWCVFVTCMFDIFWHFAMWFVKCREIM